MARAPWASLAPGVRATGTDAAWAGQGRLCVPLRAGARVLECLRCARAPPRLCPRAVRKAPTAQPDGWYVNTAGRRRLFAVTVRFHTRPKQRDRARRTVERAQSAVGCGSRTGPRGSRTAVTYRPQKNPRPHGETAPRSRRLSRRNRCPGLASCSALLSLRRRPSHGMKLVKKASTQRDALNPHGPGLGRRHLQIGPSHRLTSCAGRLHASARDGEARAREPWPGTGDPSSIPSRTRSRPLSTALRRRPWRENLYFT